MVIIDNYVLNVTKFLDEHPGGRFSIEHNIGRDISKYFYGGYALENTKKVDNHTHSSDARRIVNSLIVGKLEGNWQRKLMQVTSAEDKANEAGSVLNIKF